MNKNIMNFDRGKFELEVKQMNQKVFDELADFYATTGYSLMDIVKKCNYIDYDELNEFFFGERELTVVQLEEIDRFMMNN
jgi:hypothetical protein